VAFQINIQLVLDMVHPVELERLTDYAVDIVLIVILVHIMNGPG
jgi:hypothetical protein